MENIIFLRSLLLTCFDWIYQGNLSFVALGLGIDIKQNVFVLFVSYFYLVFIYVFVLHICLYVYEYLRHLLFLVF